MARQAAYAARQWKPSDVAPPEHVRWTWLRAMEWPSWPLFLSLPVVPVLFYFFQWYWVVVAVFALNLAWRLTIPARYVSVLLASWGAHFVHLRFVTAPLMAYLIWTKGQPWIAALAFLWPFAAGAINLFPSNIGTMQRRFILALGYKPPSEPAGRGGAVAAPIVMHIDPPLAHELATLPPPPPWTTQS